MARRRRDEEDDYDDAEDDRPRRRRDEDDYDDPRDGGSVGATIVPYKNPAALIGYYCGFLGLLPVLGVLLSPAAIILGAIGLIKRSNNPKAKGSAHAVVGIILGLVGLVCVPVWGFLLWGVFFAK